VPGGAGDFPICKLQLSTTTTTTTMLHSTAPLEEIVNANVPLQLNFDVAFDDPQIAAGILKYTVQASAQRPVLLKAECEVITAFNAVTTNVLTLGTDQAAADQLLAAANIAEGTPGFYPAGVQTGKVRLTANTQIWVKYTQTGAAATTGLAKFYINLIPLFVG
jgi:hypothetical protein